MFPSLALMGYKLFNAGRNALEITGEIDQLIPAM